MVVKPECGLRHAGGMVREMIRPMLRDWMDAQSAEMVEQMVAQEIARITHSKGRGRVHTVTPDLFGATARVFAECL